MNTVIFVCLEELLPCPQRFKILTLLRLHLLFTSNLILSAQTYSLTSFLFLYLFTV